MCSLTFLMPTYIRVMCGTHCCYLPIPAHQSTVFIPFQAILRRSLRVAAQRAHMRNTHTHTHTGHTRSLVARLANSSLAAIHSVEVESQLHSVVVCFGPRWRPILVPPLVLCSVCVFVAFAYAALHAVRVGLFILYTQIRSIDTQVQRLTD